MQRVHRGREEGEEGGTGGSLRRSFEGVQRGVSVREDCCKETLRCGSLWRLSSAPPPPLSRQDLVEVEEEEEEWVDLLQCRTDTQQYSFLTF